MEGCPARVTAEEQFPEPYSPPSVTTQLDHARPGWLIASSAPARLTKPIGQVAMRDESVLYGVMAEIEALGLGLVEVRHLTLQRKSPESGDRGSP